MWACRLEDSPSGHSLQVLAEDGSGLSATVPHANCSPSIVAHEFGQSLGQLVLGKKRLCFLLLQHHIPAPYLG